MSVSLKMKSKFKCWLFLSLTVGLSRAIDSLRVCIPDLGCLHGTHMPGFQTDQFEAFLGVPYAKPPVGEQRFKNPEPFPAWYPAVRAATQPAPECIQKNYFVDNWPIQGDEDCLYLNLYRPVNRRSAALPVILYLHGGGFFSGSPHPGVVGPEYFMDTGEVIFIAVGYRLGPFGFLSTGDEAMPGNFGLKDQNMALKWVQQHIAAFGGDPTEVTIAGHSAGAAAVHFHILYEASKGLFHRAIAMSGTAISPFASIQKQPLEQTIQLAKFVGISEADKLSTVELTEALKGVDSIRLLNATDSFKFWYDFPMTNYKPVIEDPNWENALITEDPIVLIENGNFHHVPWMMGSLSSKGEGGAYTVKVLVTPELRQELNQNFDEIVTQMLQLPKENSTAAFERLSVEYLQGKHELNNETEIGFMEVVGDDAFLYPFFKSLKEYINYADLRQNPVYVQKFNYRGPHSYSTIYTGGSLRNFGAVHLDDLLYLFRSPLLFSPDYSKDSEDASLVKVLVGSYVDFAKNGFRNNSTVHRPCSKEGFQSNPQGICDYLAYKQDRGSYKIELDNRFNLKRMQLWASILGSEK